MDHPVATSGALDAPSYRERLHASSWFGTLEAALQDALIDIAAVRRLGAGEIQIGRASCRERV